jgi:hypothetical protein
MMGDDVKKFSEAQAQRARDSWAKRRARRAGLHIVRWNRNEKVA